MRDGRPLRLVLGDAEKEEARQETRMDTKEQKSIDAPNKATKREGGCEKTVRRRAFF